MRKLLPVIALVLLFINVTLSQSPKVDVPAWLTDAVFYQIFPERFYNGDTTNDPPNTQPWGATPKYNNYFGGDLKGVDQYLDYLQSLGVNTIYFNPIFDTGSAKISPAQFNIPKPKQ